MVAVAAVVTVATVTEGAASEATVTEARLVVVEEAAKEVDRTVVMAVPTEADATVAAAGDMAVAVVVVLCVEMTGTTETTNGNVLTKGEGYLVQRVIPFNVRQCLVKNIFNLIQKKQRLETTMPCELTTQCTSSIYYSRHYSAHA
uniref:Putative secreted protein n=1 Tax=Anopheles darlingi TaxID=43151 RepID=A0A2M4D1D6_ANODA